MSRSIRDYIAERPGAGGYRRPTFHPTGALLRPHPALLPSYDYESPPYYPHPYTARHEDDEERSRHLHRGRREERRPRSPSPSIPSTPLRRSRSRASPANAATRIDARTSTELKLALAARDLADQIDESKRFWATFHEHFEKEVMGIRYYVSDDILQQIWREKIRYNSRHKSGESPDDDQFGFQQVKVETYLHQVKKTGKVLIRSQPLVDSSDQDPQNLRLTLDKIRNTGARVLDLADRSATNRTAYVDLMKEASNLEKLVDPRSPDAKVLHQFDRRETRKIASRGERGAPTPKEPATPAAKGRLDIVVVEEEDKKGRDGSTQAT
ncbi:hypothetical protein GGS23DRAFT_594059 [Durotheca rogersii]|uniref:uncharacterized protein n=1 Tax=Durotheca rogersii TaxID=419775 RepID=UPI00221F1507|nr:uncharacterized protein GGS23DRAFT_594059 [Durotheca rogersii]KAI5865894.1 hypothetical protein GGS23DRAFT_594059 [Durotheca rogersii]